MQIALTRRALYATLAAGVGLGLAASGCTPELFRNQTEQRDGSISFVFVNTTPFRAAFTFGAYDSLDRSPGPASMQQLLLEGGNTSTAITAPCRRQAAVGTQEYVDRVIDTDADNIPTFVPEALSVNINFSSAPADSDLAAVPTEGTAAGVEVQLGVDFTCNDQIIFTLVQDPDAPGGFRVDFEVLHDDELN